ncbi:MAG: hypothetical protein H7070_13315 [Saprospiraceae bacterium]|nr:hypothetical protein [Pyrinomonadaceae bacterium]
MRAVKRIYLLIAFVTVCVVLVLSCSGENKNKDPTSSADQISIADANTNNFDVAEIEQNRDLWTSKNIQNYKMIIGAEGFLTNFPEQVLVEVHSHRLKTIKSLSKTGKNHTEAYKEFNTVEKLFDFIDRAQSKKPYRLFLRYDETFGYPTMIDLDDSPGTDDRLILNVVSLESNKE